MYIVKSKTAALAAVKRLIIRYFAVHTSKKRADLVSRPAPGCVSESSFLVVPRRLSDLALIYCGKVIFARSPDHFC